MPAHIKTKAQTWAPPVEAGLAQRARRIATVIGTALRDPASVVGIQDSVGDVQPTPQELARRAPSLAGGHTGIALLATYLDECLPGEGWDQVGHSHLAAATADGLILQRLGPSLHGGWAGIVYVAHALSRDGRRYRRLLDRADAALAWHARRLASEVPRMATPLPPHPIDLISGLSGIVAALLVRRNHPQLYEALLDSLNALVSVTAHANGRPYTIEAADEGGADRGPMLNLGLAHGIPGLIAALALAKMEGVTVDGQDEAIAMLVSSLLRYRFDDDWGPTWPTAVAIEEDSSQAPSLTPARTAWCYGAPGCSRALWMAGTALGCLDWKMKALEAMRAAYRRPPERRHIPSATFCHGLAGLIHIGLRFAADTGDPELCSMLSPAVAQLVDGYNEARCFGYFSLDRKGRRRDDPGLLDGAAGVALVLLAAASDVEPSWDRVFLLS